MANADRCVCCGKIVPEGQQICAGCVKRWAWVEEAAGIRVYRYTVPHIPNGLNRYLGRENKWEYREEKKRWLEYAKIFFTDKPPKPLERSEVEIHYYFKDNRRRDPDNYCGKVILDGLTKCGIIVDDSMQVIKLKISGSKDAKNPRTEITVKEL